MSVSTQQQGLGRMDDFDVCIEVYSEYNASICRLRVIGSNRRPDLQGRESG